MKSKVEEYSEERKEQLTPEVETVDDRINRLIEVLATKNQEFTKLSQEVFHQNQDFNNRNEEAKNLKASISRQLAYYVDNTTETALKESELECKKELFNKRLLLETQLSSEHQKEVKESREELERVLSIYKDCRRNIFSFQENITKDTDDARMDTLNLVAFLKYSQSAIIYEIHKLSNQSHFPSKKENLAIRAECKQHMEKSIRSVRRVYRDRVMDYRRQERILSGRMKEIGELSGVKDHKMYDNLDAHFRGTLVSPPRSPVSNQHLPAASTSYFHIQTEPSILFPEVQLPELTYRLPSSPPGNHRPAGTPSGTRNGGSRQGRHIKTNNNKNPSHHSTVHSTNMKNENCNVSGQSGGGAKKRSVRALKQFNSSVYEPYTSLDNLQHRSLLSFAASHSSAATDSDSYNKQLQQQRENDEFLCNIALHLARAEGKQKQLTAIKEGLDIQLAKQCHLVMHLTHDLHSQLGVPLPALLRNHLMSQTHTHAKKSRNYKNQQTEDTTQPAESSQSLAELYQERNRLQVDGVMANKCRYTFDPTTTPAQVKQDIAVHAQLLDALSHQTKALLKLT